MTRPQVKVEASWRYAVLGLYRDREAPIWRLYPVPFVRLTIGRQ